MRNWKLGKCNLSRLLDGCKVVSSRSVLASSSLISLVEVGMLHGGEAFAAAVFFVYQSIHFGFVFSKQDVLHSVGNLVKPIYFIANERKRWQMLR
jgi:hypothetical protein